MNQSLERLSSGYRINKAADDAAGLSMSNKFLAQIASMSAASRNTSQATSLLQIAEGGTDQVSQILTRLKELATEASSANNSQNLTDINNEASSLLSEIDRIAASTTFQGRVLLTGSFGAKSVSTTLTADNTYNFNTDNAAAATYSVAGTSVAITVKNLTTSVAQTLATASGSQTYSFGTLGISFQTTGNAIGSTIGVAVGAAIDATVISVLSTGSTFQVGELNNTNYQISFKIDGATTVALSVGTVNLSTAAGGQTALTTIDNAIDALNSIKSKLGATMNRLGYTSSNLSIASENASAANSVIKDVDMASEMTSFTKNQILVQAGTAMLAQANASKQTILSLFK